MSLHKLFIVIFLLVIFNSQAQTCIVSTVNNFLTDLFHDTSYISYDNTKFLSFADAKTTVIGSPFLKTLLPNYCFFSTEFESDFYEYREVETAIAFRSDTISKSIIIHSPVFTQENKSFIELFYDLNVQDSLAKIELCKEVMTILSNITYKGHINQLINLEKKNTISFELWQDDLSWRIYDFYFDKNRLIKIEINGGVKRDRMLDTYKRI